MDEDDIDASDYNDPSEVTTQDDSGDESDSSLDLSASGSPGGGISVGLATGLLGAGQTILSAKFGTQVAAPVVVAQQSAVSRSAVVVATPSLLQRISSALGVSTKIVAWGLVAVVAVAVGVAYKIFRGK